MTDLTHYELLLRMGCIATDAEADVMMQLLKERGITTEEKVDAMSNREWSQLLCDAIEQTQKGGAK
jgi:hypothetical protein